MVGLFRSGKLGREEGRASAKPVQKDCRNPSGFLATAGSSSKFQRRSFRCVRGVSSLDLAARLTCSGLSVGFLVEDDRVARPLGLGDAMLPT